MFIMQWFGLIDEEHHVVALIGEDPIEDLIEEKPIEEEEEAAECNVSSNVNIQLGIRLEIKCKLNLGPPSDHLLRCPEQLHKLSG